MALNDPTPEERLKTIRRQLTKYRKAVEALDLEAMERAVDDMLEVAEALVLWLTYEAKPSELDRWA